MANSYGGANSDEVAADLAAAKKAGNVEVARYLEGVLEDRKKRKAVVEGAEIVLGNPDAYTKQAVEDQKEDSIGRPHITPVSADDLGVRGAEAVAAAQDAADAPKQPAAKK